MIDFEADLPIFFDTDEFSEQILYVSTSKTIHAIVDVGVEYDEAGRICRKLANITYKNTDVTVAPGDQFLFHGLYWTTMAVIEQDRVTSVAKLRSKEAIRHD